MGSSSVKKHKKDRKHRHRSRSEHSHDDSDIKADGHESDGRHKHHHHHHKHKKHKSHKEKHKHRHREKERTEVVIQCDSDSSDCVEVPVGNDSVAAPPPPPPKLSKHDYEKQKLKDQEREYEYAREREREEQRERERLIKERERYEREKERERYEREREKEREREREREKERERERLRYEREKERERYEREREMERRRDKERERDRDREKDRDRHNDRDREQYRERDRSVEHSRAKDYEVNRERSRSHSPINENGAGDVLSIEETNKLRAKLGLKPLEVDSGPLKPAETTNSTLSSNEMNGEKKLSSYKDEWGEFLHKPAEDIREKSDAEKLREKLKVRKEKRFIEERLKQIRSLAESDDEVDDVSKWVQRNKRVVDERKEAEQRAKALEEMDAAFGVNYMIEKEKAEARRKAYNEKDLRGLKVDHDMDEFTEGKTIILTLKDKDVLDEAEGDTLVNVNLIDEERYRKNVENKKLNPLSYGYNVYEEQYDELGNPIERSILSKYDEEIGKEKQKNFVIGHSVEEEIAHKRKLLEIKTKLAGKRLETLQDVQIQLASDTFTDAEMTKFKKPKKKVKKLREKLKAEDLEPLVDGKTKQNFGSRNGRYRDHEDDDVDMNMDSKDVTTDLKLEPEEEEQDLQRVLAKARKLKQKENIIKKPLPIDIEQIKNEIKEEPDENNEETVEGALELGHIILNSTAEFCRTLGDIPTYGMAGNRNEIGSEMMDFEEQNGHDDIVHTEPEKPEVSYGTWNSVNPDEVNQPADLDNLVEEPEERAILDEEPDVGAGVANALRLALSKGYLEKEESNRPSNSKLAHLQAQNYSIEDKASVEDDKFGRRDRFHAGPIMDFKDKETFKPNVKLEYIDDNGRVLNSKEAFRYLSHKFHGKGPGKNKIEKRLKKMEQESLMKTMSSTDTPLGTLSMLQQKQKETKTPFVVLSGSKQTLANPVISKFK